MLKRPELRLADGPGNLQLAQLLMAIPEDEHLQELFQLITRTQVGQTIICDDPYLEAYPPKGSIIYPSDFLCLATMPTGDPVGVIISQLTGNVLFIGRTKSSKTALLTVLLSCPQLLKNARIVVFAKKREIRDLSTIPELRDLIITFKLEELVLCYFQPPAGVLETAWNNEITRLIAQCYGRYSAQRLMGDKVRELTAKHPDGVYPTLRQLAGVIDAFKPHFGGREAAYKDSIEWCLKDLLNSTGSIWDYSYSDFLEQLYSQAGLCIVEAEAVPPEHLTFIATYFMRWIYFKRIYAYEVAS
jgi:hypothetical protein